MTDSHSNYFPEAGQKQGDAHPQNPWSEQQYPSFFRLRNRAELLADPKNPPRDLDPDFFVSENWEKFMAEVTAQRQEPEQLFRQDMISTNFDAESGAYEHKPEVEAESEPHHYLPSEEYAIRDSLNDRLFPIVQLYPSLHKFFEAQQPKWFDQQKWQALVDRLALDMVFKNSIEVATVPSEEQAKSMYENVLTSYGEYQAPAPIVLSVEKELFQIMGGSPDYRFGGWTDGDYLPAKFRSLLMKNGLNVTVTGNLKEKMHILKNLRNVHVYGKEIGSALDKAAVDAFKIEVDFKRKKIGSWVAGLAYGGLALWAIWNRWTIINNREYNRQMWKFSWRALAEENPQTPVVEQIAKKHEEWAKTYYADEEEEEAEEEESDE